MPPPSLRALALYFLRLGATGFGGPIALAAAMHRDLVERRRWVSDAEYADGLALAQLAPGPLAAQLAMYLGWVRGGVPGSMAAGVAFVAPSFVMVLAIAVAYVRFDGLPWMQAAFYGVGAAVIAIVLRSAVRLIRATAARDRLLWAVVVTNALSTAYFEAERVSVILAGGLAVAAVRARHAGAMPALALVPAVWSPVPAAAASPALFWFFVKAGAFVFGSGLAIVPFLYGGVVRDFQWLTDQQFLDAVAVAMITPGPVVITVAFIGFLVDGWFGAAAAALGVFLPCWLLVVLPAPYFARLSADPRLRSFIAGLTASASGAIAGAVFVLARRAIIDLPALLLFAVTLIVLARAKRVPEPVWILLAGAGAVAFR